MVSVISYIIKINYKTRRYNSVNTKNKLTELLNNNEFVFLDGAMGTMLQNSGVEIPQIPEELNITNPRLIIDIQRKYLMAGSNIIYSNTFGANRYKTESSKYSLSDLIEAAIFNANQARQEYMSWKETEKGEKAQITQQNQETIPPYQEPLIAQSLGPIGKLLEPTGTLPFEDAYETFKEQILAGKDADIIAIETMTDLYEMKAAILAAKENSDKPVICTMSFEKNMRTFTGCCVSSMAITIEALGADAIGLNCSLGPKEMFPIIEELSNWTNLPIIIKPNAGLPDPITGGYSITPKEFTKYMVELIPLGVKILGGCCGTNPEFIKELTDTFKSKTHIAKTVEIPSAICTPEKTVIIDEPRIIGERINPTGKKLLKDALKNNDLSYILSQAISQIKDGAEILDVNVGMPDIEEAEMMVKCVKAVQGITNVPLQIDSNDPAVLEAALRIYNGKPIVNSVNGKEESLITILPLVKKYGASVVGLTLDEDGIPATCEKRVEIASSMLNRALSIGIPRRDLYIDCLTLTVSAEQKAAMDTLKAVSIVKNKLGLKTVLGVSNISFGLPNRPLINHNFLTMALTMGLDLPIMNPGNADMVDSVFCYKLLSAKDVDSKNYIKKYKDLVISEGNRGSGNSLALCGNSSALSGNMSGLALSGNTSEAASSKDISSDINTLFFAIENGLTSECRRLTEVLLEQKEPMEIINDILIPVLDKAGINFESGSIFLPQLILIANTCQSAFDVIKLKLATNDMAPVSKGKIILATVKGDIHDIGKNITKVLLENYGYTVIDLGKDVEPQLILETAIQQQVRLVGLSALMTTTLKSMEETIRLIHENNLNTEIMVGGAVLTANYAKKIGADYYVKDAKESTDIAKQIFR